MVVTVTRFLRSFQLYFDNVFLRAATSNCFSYILFLRTFSDISNQSSINNQSFIFMKSHILHCAIVSNTVVLGFKNIELNNKSWLTPSLFWVISSIIDISDHIKRCPITFHNIRTFCRHPKNIVFLNYPVRHNFETLILFKVALHEIYRLGFEITFISAIND